VGRVRVLRSPRVSDPPHLTGREAMDEQQWIDANAARLREALAAPQVRADVLAQLGADDDRRRERRLEAARLELAGLELRWRLEDEDGL
jgi:hypothetical protein